MEWSRKQEHLLSTGHQARCEGACKEPFYPIAYSMFPTLISYYSKFASFRLEMSLQLERPGVSEAQQAAPGLSKKSFEENIGKLEEITL